MIYQVWMEGYIERGEQGGANEHSLAWLMGYYDADSFEQACVYALLDRGWSLLKHWNPTYCTYMGSKLYDNEADARRSFG